MRQESYGQRGLTPVDRFGVYLSQRPVLQVVQRYREPVVLDLGCGFQARMLRDLLPRIGAGVGVDVQISPEAKQTPRLSFYEQTVEQVLPLLPAQRFDVVLMVSVLEHLWEPQQILTACYQLLKPGGSLVVNVPNWRGKFFLEFSAFKLGLSPAVEMDDHKMYYDKHDLWPLLVRAGFAPSRISLRYHKFGLNLFAVSAKGQ